MANLPPYRIYWHAPQPIFTARVNAPGAIVYPVQDIAFDNVTVGAFGDLAADMLVTFGSAEGLDDLGRTRLRAAATSTILKISRASQGTEDGQVDILDNAWVHVYPDFRVHSKIPVIGSDYDEYKDTDIPVGDLTAEPPPVAVLGPDRARRIDATSGLARLFFDGGNSYAVADAATIVSYAWDIGDGTFVLGTTATDAAIYADFPAGVRYVSLTVVDSNGKSHSGRRLVLAHDPDDSLCVSGMQVTNLTRTDKGLSVRLRVLQDLPRADYPDGAHVLIFEDRDPAIFGTPDPTDWSDVLFTGWHSIDEASSTAQETHLRRETQLTCVDVLARLDALPGFPQRLEVPDAEEGLTWGEMPAANMDKFLCYLIHWHSTAASVADFFPSGTWDEYPFVLFDASGDTLYNQLQRQAARIVPDHNFTSDRYGRMAVVVNPQYQNPADRTTTIHNSLTEQGWSAIEFGYNRNPRVHTLRGSALLTQTEWLVIDDDKALVEPVFSIAPGTAPGQGGREQKLGERLAQSQQDLNDTIGHHYARMNARYGDINVTLNLNADPWDFNPAAFTWVTLHTTAATAPQRGLDFETIRCLCKEVSIDYVYGEEATTWRGRVVLEPETVGLPALTEVHEGALPVGTQPEPPPPPPDFGLISGQELVAGADLDGHLYRTSDFQTPSGSGGPTWDRVDTGITETIYSWVVDPFSPGYLTGTGAINGWIATETDIYRVEDIFGTPNVTSVHTFAVTASASSFHWRSIQASFGAFFETGNPWLLCVSYYGDTAEHEGTWALRSLNGGATWQTEVQVSEYYDSDTPTRFMPIGVYTSPKTPGLAYTAAHLPTLTGDLPRWGSFDNDDVFTLGAVAPSASLSVDASATGGGDQDEAFLILAPPPDAVRVQVRVDWSAYFTRTGGFGSRGVDLQTPSQTGLTRTGVTGFTDPPTGNSTSAGSGILEYTLHPSFADWPINTTTIVSSPPATPAGLRLRMVASLASVSAGETWTAGVAVTVTILEIELDDGTIYGPGGVATQGQVSTDWGETWTPAASIQPGQAQAGSIHFPYADNASEQIAFYGAFDKAANREFRLLRADGASVGDVSPADGSRSYGVNRYGFAARAYDSDRQYIVASVMGNDTSADPADDMHAVYISANDGGTWSEVIAPMADSGAPANRPAFEAAFAGDTEQVVYIWGPPGYISYSSNFGVSVDSREGNLSSFSPSGFLGICGGPIT